ncbi:hypothetical protein MTR_3g051710 [Medicago truncatula]|uniref:Uncharacterized protein n=1 Tax=Medicago truncatula TaxID=3880 RepID=G7IY02_MEDTR|nr:hypothetical protein MTR_3g051710 [Medicago truncatula]
MYLGICINVFKIKSDWLVQPITPRIGTAIGLNRGFATSFLANSSLCADTPILNITLCNSGIQSENKGSSRNLCI